MVLPAGSVLALAGDALVVEEADAVREIRAVVVVGVVLARAGQEREVAHGVCELGCLSVCEICK